MNESNENRVQDLAKAASDIGYENVRVLPDGTLAGTMKLIFTTAICTDIEPFGIGYGNRFCFESKGKALEELAKLKSSDDIPEGWIARR